MQGHGQLDHAQPCAEMASRYRDYVNRLLAQLGRELLQLLARERAQLGRIGNPVQQWSLR
jgi:hypothetical protein